jgi:hypothetical protein
MRSLITSRSNSANDIRMFSVRRPMLFAVENCCVTETNVTLCFSKRSINFAKSRSERLSLSIL